MNRYFNQQMKSPFVKAALFSLVVAFLFSVFGIASAKKKDDEMEVVFFNPDSGSQNPVDATNALQTFCNVLKKRRGWNLRAYFFKKKKDLDHFLDSRKVDFGILSQIYVVENYKKRGIVPFVIPVRNGKTTYRKVILVQKAKHYHDLQDLKGKVLASTALGDENIPFYNKVVFRGEIDVRKHFKEIKLVDSANSAIMALLYGQVDAAAVTLASFTIMKDLNPQISRKLESIYTSAETPISPMCYFKNNIDLKILPEMKKILLTMHNDPVGRQSMLAFQVEAWENTSMANFKETERILHGLSQKPTPAPVVEVAGKQVTKKPAEEIPVIKRIQAYKDNGKFIVNTWVEEAKPGIDTKATKVKVSIAGAAWTVNNMTYLNNNKYTYSIDLPKKAASPESKEIVYKVKSGDTLGKIARKFLKSSKKYMIIATYNKIQNPNLIYIGQILKFKAGETKVTQVKFVISAKDLKGKEVKSSVKSKFIL